MGSLRAKHMTRFLNPVMGYILALALSVSALMSHATHAASEGAMLHDAVSHAAMLEEAQLAEASTDHVVNKCGLPQGLSDEGNACAATAGHCQTVSCDPYVMTELFEIHFDVSHPPFHVKSYTIFKSIETPPPRA